MASEDKPNGYWANEKNQRKAIHGLLSKHSLLDPIEAGRHLTLKMIDSSPCTNIRAYAPTKYDFLRIYFRQHIKEWMIWKHSRKIHWTQRKVAECFDSILKRTGKDIDSISIKEFEKAGGHRLLFDYRHDFNRIKDIYSGSRRKPWEHRQVPRKFWKLKKNKIAATRWLIDEKLKYPKNRVPELITSDDFDDNGLSTVLFRTSICELVLAAYPERGYSRRRFRQANIRSALGYGFENVVYKILNDGLRMKYARQFTVPRCEHPIRCRIDISGLNLHRLVRSSDGVDVKLFSYTYFHSSSRRYLDHFRRLVVIYLDGAQPKKNYPGVKFINVDKLLSLIPDLDVRKELENEVGILRMGKFPMRLQIYERAARSANKSLKCILIKSGKCTKERRTDTIGIPVSLGLCSKHLMQLRAGKIDENGTRLKPFLERVSLSDKQIRFLKSKYKSLNNQQLAEQLFGVGDRRHGGRVNNILTRLGLRRSPEEIARVRGQVLLYDKKTLSVLTRNWRTHSAGQLCQLLKLPDNTRNKSRIHEALLRHGIRPKSKPYTKRKLISELRRLAKKLGRIPVARDLDRQPDFPGKGTYTLYFGSWARAKEAAGFKKRASM